MESSENPRGVPFFRLVGYKSYKTLLDKKQQLAGELEKARNEIEELYQERDRYIRLLESFLNGKKEDVLFSEVEDFLIEQGEIDTRHDYRKLLRFLPPVSAIPSEYYRTKIDYGRHYNRPPGTNGFAERIARKPYVHSLRVREKKGKIKSSEMSVSRNGKVNIFYSNSGYGVRIEVNTTAETKEQTMLIAAFLAEELGIKKIRL
jgi:hypothetical protein